MGGQESTLDSQTVCLFFECLDTQRYLGMRFDGTVHALGFGGAYARWEVVPYSNDAMIKFVKLPENIRSSFLNLDFRFQTSESDS